eukprot:UN05442
MMSQCCPKCLTQCGPPPNRYIVFYLDQTKIGQSFNAEEHRCSDPPHNFVLVPMPRADPNLFAEFARQKQYVLQCLQSLWEQFWIFSGPKKQD